MVKISTFLLCFVFVHLCHRRSKLFYYFLLPCKQWCTQGVKNVFLFVDFTFLLLSCWLAFSSTKWWCGGRTLFVQSGWYMSVVPLHREGGLGPWSYSQPPANPLTTTATGCGDYLLNVVDGKGSIDGLFFPLLVRHGEYWKRFLSLTWFARSWIWVVQS